MCWRRAAAFRHRKSRSKEQIVVLDFATKYHPGQWFLVGDHMDPLGACNIPEGPQTKYNKLGVRSDILVVKTAITR